MGTNEGVKMSHRLGIWNVLSDQSIVPLAYSGLDFAIIDLEHGYRDFSSCQSMVQGMLANQVEVFVRIRNSQDVLVQSFLDLGVSKFVVPQVRAIDQIKELISRVNFPPNGVRSYHPRYSKLKESSSNKNLVQLYPIIETRQILEFQQELFKLENVAGAYFGNFDLSLELNCSAELSDPLILEALNRSISNVTEAGKIFIVMPKGKDEMEMLSKKGVTDFVVGIDSEMLFSSVQTTKDLYKAP